MLAGALIYGVRYTVPEYVCTVLVAAGVSVFALFKVREYLCALGESHYRTNCQSIRYGHRMFCGPESPCSTSLMLH